MDRRAAHLPATYEPFPSKRIQVHYNWQADHPRVKTPTTHLSKPYQNQNRTASAITIGPVQRIDPMKTSIVALTMVLPRVKFLESLLLWTIKDPPITPYSLSQMYQMLSLLRRVCFLRSHPKIVVLIPAILKTR